MSTATAPESPPQLFLKLWQIAEAASASARLNAPPAARHFKEMAARCLGYQKLSDCTKGLGLLIGDAGIAGLNLGQVLALMVTIDKAFDPIHPRSVVTVAGGLRCAPWLSDLKTLRRGTGHYATAENFMLVPRGPLCRQQRAEYASNADTVADRFAYLAVVPTTAKQSARPINIRIKVIEAHAAQGVSPSANRSNQLIAFVPVAEKASDFQPTVRVHSEKKFIDFRLAPGVDAPRRLIEAIEKAGALDFAMAPELVMSQDHADRLAELVLELNARPRVIMAGSGPTRDREGAQSWNEATTLNGIGAVLWTQRKILQAGIKQPRAIQFGLEDPGKEGMLHEDNASGSEIVIADIAGVGRCVVFICQDIDAPPLTEQILTAFQPDWVLVPVLDPCITKGNWVHQQTWKLSGISKARFLVSCSTALGRDPHKHEDLACGLAVGPRDPSEEDGGRMMALISNEHPSPPGLGIIQWKEDIAKWEKTTLGSSAISPKA
jgi:hypothetical protein